MKNSILFQSTAQVGIYMLENVIKFEGTLSKSGNG
jgi:hypothetical protein